MTKNTQKCTLIPINRCTPMTKIHIGKLIKEKFRNSGYTTTELAAILHCDRTNIYRIFNRQSIDCELLNNISKALHYDFLKEYSLHEIQTQNEIQLTIKFTDKKIIITKPDNLNIEINNKIEKK